MTSCITQITVYPVVPGGMPECVKEALKIVNGSDGWIRAYSGVQTEDRGLGYWILDWESADHRDAFLTDEVHAPVLDAVKAMVDQSPEKDKAGTLQVLFDPPHPTAAFGAPVTEIAVGTLRPGADEEAYRIVMSNVVDAFRREGCVEGVAWGKIISDDSRPRYTLVVGWESLEACQRAAVARSEHELYEEIGALADYEVKLVSLRRHEKFNA